MPAWLSQSAWFCKTALYFWSGRIFGLRNYPLVTNLLCKCSVLQLQGKRILTLFSHNCKRGASRMRALKRISSSASSLSTECPQINWVVLLIVLLKNFAALPYCPGRGWELMSRVGKSRRRLHLWVSVSRRLVCRASGQAGGSTKSQKCKKWPQSSKITKPTHEETNSKTAQTTCADAL